MYNIQEKKKLVACVMIEGIKRGRTGHAGDNIFKEKKKKDAEKSEN